MTITTIRFTACGDIHDNLINLDKIKAFILDMKSQGKVDFAGFLGDYVSSSADVTQLNNVKARFDVLGIKYYAATGNHDASGSNCYNNCSSTIPTLAASCAYKTSFGYFPDQYPPVTDFTKDGTTFQILIPGMCWSGGAFWKYDFANANISKTKPTIVFNHGPVLKPTGITCGAWDSLHEYAFSMKSQLDALNMLAVYGGHTHSAGFQVINGRLYVAQDSINSSRCSGAADKHRNIGYTKITYDSSTNKATVQYQNMEYMDASNVVNKFVDPFPDTVAKYSCTGSPNFQCVVDPNGPYNTLAECQAACKAPTQKYRCTGSPDFQCIVDPTGPYNTLAECQAACHQPIVSDIQQIIENVTNSIGYRYQTKDNKGNSMDTIKVIESPIGGYIGIYHTLVSGTFRIKLATSIDLKNWTYKIDLDNNASQPYIVSLSDGRFLVAMEAHAPNHHLRFKHYPNINNLFSGSSDKIFDAPQTLSTHAEGTPNIYSATLSPDISHSDIDVGFHYYKDGIVDRQARGRLVNFSTWTTKVETQVNSVVEALGTKGNIGDRDNIIYNGKSYNIIEGQLVKGDWSSWRCFLYDWSTNTAAQLNIKTHKGSKAFANPSFTKVRDPTGNPALVVTLFIPSQGAVIGEAGELIYYSRITEITKRYTCKQIWKCVENPDGEFSSLEECQRVCEAKNK